MVPQLGHFSLILALCLVFAQSFIPLVGLHRGYNTWVNATKSIAIGNFCFLLLSLVCSKNEWDLTSFILFLLSGGMLGIALSGKVISTKIKVHILSAVSVASVVFILITANPFSRTVLLSLSSSKNVNSAKIAHSIIGQPFPSFTVASTADEKIVVTQNDLLGKVSLVNIWATWCVSCRVEHLQLLKLARDNKIFVVGINYKDDKQAAQKWLGELGNPYFFSVYDGDGKLSAQLGVSGAPETYVVDKQGIVRYKYAGVVSDDVWQTRLKPEFDKWQAEK